MSKERDILLAKYNQLIDYLEETDPIKYPQEFKEALDLIDRLYFTTGRLNAIEDNKIYAIGDAVPVPRPVVKLDDEPSVEEYAPPVIEPVTSTELRGSCNVGEKITDPEPAKTYSKEEVRAALAKSRKQGVNVTELLDELGYDNFSAVPAGKYREIMARLGES